jgi:hypothetical protein
MAPEAARQSAAAELFQPMNSSIQQLHNTPVSTMGPTTRPLVTRGPGKRQSRLTPDQEQAITEAINQFYLGVGGRPKVHAYRVYRAWCAQFNAPHVTLRTFCRRLNGYPAPRPQRPLFKARALYGQMTIQFPILGGSSS